MLTRGYAARAEHLGLSQSSASLAEADSHPSKHRRRYFFSQYAYAIPHKVHRWYMNYTHFHLPRKTG